MTKTLEDRLRDTKGVFLTATGEVTRSTNLPPDVHASFHEILEFGESVEHWLSMLQTRKLARQMLTDLESRADSQDEVPFGSNRIRFQHARLIGVQAYLSTNWAIADQLTGMVGQIFCNKQSSADPKHPPQLVSHFVSREHTKTKTAALLFTSIRQTFGWPISVSYAIRNHFIHDGGQRAGVDFFDGIESKDGFRISIDGWAGIESTARQTSDVSHHRAAANWPTAPCDDLRAVLDACERETDDALGILVGSACRSLVTHIGFVLGTD